MVVLREQPDAAVGSKTVDLLQVYGPVYEVVRDQVNKLRERDLLKAIAVNR